MTGIVVVNGILNPPSSYVHYILFYLLYILLFGIAYDLVAIAMGKYYGFSFQKKDISRLLSAIIFDIFVYRFASMYFVIYGSISYFFNKKWNKVARTGRNYQTDSKPAA
jgi:hypothetical protein